MTEAFFPDNTVLCNFASVDRVDLLLSASGGGGRRPSLMRRLLC